MSGLQECNYVTLQYKQVMTRAQPPLAPKLTFFGLHPYCFILLPVGGMVTCDVRGGQEVN